MSESLRPPYPPVLLMRGGGKEEERGRRYRHLRKRQDINTGIIAYRRAVFCVDFIFVN